MHQLLVSADYIDLMGKDINTVSFVICYEGDWCRSTCFEEQIYAHVLSTIQDKLTR
jgi:hypothetical protein